MSTNRIEISAFPSSSAHSDERNPGWIGGGMTLLDYFASDAMKGLLAGRFKEIPSDYHELIVEAWEIADGMLAEKTRRWLRDHAEAIRQA